MPVRSARVSLGRREPVKSRHEIDFRRFADCENDVLTGKESVISSVREGESVDEFWSTSKSFQTTLTKLSWFQKSQFNLPTLKDFRLLKLSASFEPSLFEVVRV